MDYPTPEVYVHCTTIGHRKSQRFWKDVIRFIYVLIIYKLTIVIADSPKELDATYLSTSSNISLSYDQTSLVTSSITSFLFPSSSAIISNDNSTITNSSHRAINTRVQVDTGQLSDQLEVTTVHSTEESFSSTLDKNLLRDSNPLLNFTVADTEIIRDVITNSITDVDVRSIRLSMGALAKKGHESSEDDSSEEKSDHKSSNPFLYFLYAISNRTTLCSLLNGTCLTPTDCPILKLYYLSQYGHGGHRKLGSLSFDCNLTTICCSPFLLTGIFDSHHTKHKDDSSSDDSDEKYSNDVDNHKTEPYNLPSAPSNTGYEQHGISQAYPAVVSLTSHGQSSYARRSRRSRRRRRVVRRRTKRSRRRRFKHNFFGSIFSDVTNRTALCLLRNGVCISPSDCATNSAISPGASYGGLLHSGALNSHSDDYSEEHGHQYGHQIRSFLCNYTAICCLPLFDNYAGFSLGGLGGGLFSSSYGHQGLSYRELKSGDENTRLSHHRRRRHRRIQSVLPVRNVRLRSDEDRQNLCIRSNGTCVVPTSCDTAATYSDEHPSFHCNLTSVCCLPLSGSLDGKFGVGQQLFGSRY